MAIIGVTLSVTVFQAERRISHGSSPPKVRTALSGNIWAHSLTPKPIMVALSVVSLLVLSSCSPRDFLTRRLAADLISTSNTFRAPRQFQFHTGVLSNKDYLAPDYLALQHHGWISSTQSHCPSDVTPPPCWDVALTPSGVEAFQNLISPSDAEKQSFTISAAGRELIAVTGIAKHGRAADVEFAWHWIPLNEVGAAINTGDLRYSSTVSFRRYDDGWRVIENTFHSGRALDEALKNAEPAE